MSEEETDGRWINERILELRSEEVVRKVVRVEVKVKIKDRGCDVRVVVVVGKQHERSEESC